MRTLIETAMFIGLLMVASWPALAAPASGEEVGQVLFAIDSSGSMSDPAGDPAAPGASKWQMLQKAYPEWLKRLPGKVLVGAVSIGGGGFLGPTGFEFPVGSDRNKITAAIQQSQPAGGTPLNATLLGSPRLFAEGKGGAKRIVLISDGGNTDPPFVSTCEIVERLKRDHGIGMDVVIVGGDPGLWADANCWAQAGGGMVTLTKTLSGLRSIPLPKVDPWRLLVAGLMTLGLLLTTTAAYRHGHFVHGWPTEKAIVRAGAFGGLGLTMTYLVLFCTGDLRTCLFGAALLVALLLLFDRQSRQPAWKTATVVLALALGSGGVAEAAHATGAEAGQAMLAAEATQVNNAPAEVQVKRHHIVAVDMSKSFRKCLEQGKSLLGHYGEAFIHPGDEITLVLFSEDETGEARELETWTVPASGSLEHLKDLVDVLEIGDEPTKTYYAPLAAFINDLLRRVTKEPVVVVLSDGISDGFRDARRGLIKFNEIPFERFGPQGFFRAPWMGNWKVAIQTGATDLDFRSLFKRTVTVKGQNGKRGAESGPAIDPELITPELIATTEGTLTLRPSLLNKNVREGVLVILVSHKDVIRNRSFRVELDLGGTPLVLGCADNVAIGPKGYELQFPVKFAEAGPVPKTGTVQLVVEQGSQRLARIRNPPVLEVVEAGYLKTHGLRVGGVLGGLLGLLTVGMASWGKRQKMEAKRRQIVKTSNGRGVPLSRGNPITMGGPGCALEIWEANTTGAKLVWNVGQRRGELNIEAAESNQIRICGEQVMGTGVYQLGHQALQIVDKSGVVHDVVLYEGDERDVFGGDVFARGPELCFEVNGGDNYI